MPKATGQGEFNPHPRGKAKGSPREAIDRVRFRLDILERALDKGHTAIAQQQLEAIYPSLLRLGLMHDKRLKKWLVEALQASGAGGPVQVEPSDENTLVIEGVFSIEKMAKFMMW